ncbi:protein of unknown function [Cupriavidus taiwanensis]|uniref:Uncharacterized protein n=1 Tax=Cupriavidus taiwanensis TaxID=164546 RepID=A0A375ID03_9BURK|nr:protein of unknown function [Cupriavidus taiwanensis]
MRSNIAIDADSRLAFARLLSGCHFYVTDVTILGVARARSTLNCRLSVRPRQWPFPMQIGLV